MNYWNAYLTVFSFLDDYLNSAKNSDLAGLLGSMSPYIFSHNRPIDNSMENDWITLYSVAIENNDMPEQVKIFKSMLLFLERQQRKLGLAVTDFISQLSNLDSGKLNDNPLWIRWIEIYSYWSAQPNYNLGDSIPTYP